MGDVKKVEKTQVHFKGSTWCAGASGAEPGPAIARDDATARAIDLRPSAAEEEHSAGGEDVGSAEWQAALRRLDELEVVTAEDIPKLPTAPEADAQILGLPSQPSAPKDAAEEAAAAAARKKAFRRAILPWHPDVMMRRLGGRLAADGYDAAYAVVTSNSIRVLEAAERLGAA